MSSPFTDWLLGEAERIDSEFGCCHKPEQIVLMLASGGGATCEGVETYQSGIKALRDSLRAADHVLTDLMVRCLHGPNCYCEVPK